MKNISRVLLIANDAQQTNDIRAELDKVEFKTELDVVRNKKELSKYLDQNSVDLFICYQSKDFAALDSLKYVRDISPTLPFLLVSEHINEVTLTSAFQNGLTNYIENKYLTRLCPIVNREILNSGQYQGDQLHESLLQSVNGIVWDIDANTFEYNYISPKSEDILGYPPSLWYKDIDFWENHLHPDDVKHTVDYFLKKSKKGEDHTLEYRILTDDGRIVWIRDYITISFKNGKPSKLRGMMVDITKEKKVERQRELAYEIAEIGDWELDTVNEKLFWSNAVKRLHEVPDNYEPTLNTALEFYKGIHKQTISKAVDSALKTGKPFLEEIAIVTHKGNEIWVRVVGETDFIDGKCVRIYGSTQNITQQKVADLKLQESLKRYNYVIKATSDAIYDWDIITDHFEWEDGFRHLFGHETAGQFPLELWAKMVHYEDVEEVQQSLHAALQSKSVNQWESIYRLQKADGAYSHVKENGYIIRNEAGHGVRMIGALRDITDKHELEKLLEDAQKIARIGAWEVHIEKKKSFWSPITKTIHGIDPDIQPSLDKSITFYKEGKSRETIKKVLSRAINDGKSFDVEVQLITASGHEKWVRVKAESSIVNGKCVRLYGSIQDIHKRKSAELNSLKAHEEREHILNRITDGFFAVDKNWMVTYWNRAAEKMLNMTGDHIIGKNLWEVYEDASNLNFYDQYHKAIEEQLTVHFVEFYPGVGVWLEVSAYPSEEGLSVFFRDITKRKGTEHILRELYQKNRLVLESTGEGIYGIDTEGRCTFINKAAANMLGYRSEECIGKNMHQLIHHQKPNGDPYPESECPIFISKKEHKSCRVVDEVFWKADGTCFNVEYTSNPMIQHGEIKGGVVAFSDITKRKQQEKELQESLKEKETLLIEIHHRVKNNLAIISSMMQLQTLKVDNEYVQDVLNDSIYRIKTMAMIHELLYKSPSFSKIYLNKNIELLISTLTDAFEVSVNLDVQFNMEDIELNINQAIPCMLLMNEVVTNILKHAFRGRKNGNLTVELSEKSESLTLKISDDGVGLPDNFNSISNEGSVGLILIKTLAEQLDGEFSYQNLNPGTSFTFSFKKTDIQGIGNAHL